MKNSQADIICTILVTVFYIQFHCTKLWSGSGPGPTGPCRSQWLHFLELQGHRHREHIPRACHGPVLAHHLRVFVFRQHHRPPWMGQLEWRHIQKLVSSKPASFAYLSFLSLDFVKEFFYGFHCALYRLHNSANILMVLWAADAFICSSWVTVFGTWLRDAKTFLRSNSLVLLLYHHKDFPKTITSVRFYKLSSEREMNPQGSGWCLTPGY